MQPVIVWTAAVKVAPGEAADRCNQNDDTQQRPAKIAVAVKGHVFGGVITDMEQVVVEPAYRAAQQTEHFIGLCIANIKDLEQNIIPYE